MSEESTPKKKAARKSVRKKSASKKTVTRKAAAPVKGEEESLPLMPEKEGSSAQEESQIPKKNLRSAKSGVRDLRKESPGEEESQSSEKEERSRPSTKKAEASSNDGNLAEESGNKNRRNRGRGRRSGGSSEAKNRVPIEFKKLKEKAWKIYLSEVTEEGLALLDDHALRAYARGSLNAARIYLEEEIKEMLAEKREKPSLEGKKDS